MSLPVYWLDLIWLVFACVSLRTEPLLVCLHHWVHTITFDITHTPLRVCVYIHEDVGWLIAASTEKMFLCSGEWSASFREEVKHDWSLVHREILTVLIITPEFLSFYKLYLYLSSVNTVHLQTRAVTITKSLSNYFDHRSAETSPVPASQTWPPAASLVGQIKMTSLFSVEKSYLTLPVSFCGRRWGRLVWMNFIGAVTPDQSNNVWRGVVWVTVEALWLPDFIQNKMHISQRPSNI